MIEYKLSTEEVNIVLAGLAKLPYEVSCNLIRNLQEQYIAAEQKTQPSPTILEDKK